MGYNRAIKYMKKIIILVSILTTIFGANLFAQQETYWYKITERYDKHEDYRSTVKEEMYYKVVITSKGAVLTKDIKNAKDYENSYSNTYGNVFLKYLGFKNNYHVFEYKITSGPVGGAQFTSDEKELLLSSDKSSMNYKDVYNPFVMIGQKVSEPKHLLNSSEYKMY